MTPRDKYRLAERYLDIGSEDRISEITEMGMVLLLEAAQEEYVGAMNLLAQRYLQPMNLMVGPSDPVDAEKGFEWTLKAAKAGCRWCRRQSITVTKLVGRMELS